MMTIRAFMASDAVEIANRDGQQCHPEQIMRQAACGPSFTAVSGGKAIACAGVMIPSSHVGFAWAVISEMPKSQLLAISKAVRRILKTIITAHRLHRVEAFALESSSMNQRWIEWLGFSVERDGIARRYMPDKQSIVRYEWVGA